MTTNKQWAFYIIRNKNAYQYYSCTVVQLYSCTGTRVPYRTSTVATRTVLVLEYGNPTVLLPFYEYVAKLDYSTVY